MLLRLWILLCATLVTAGWILSLVRSLNGPGYLAVLAVYVIGVVANAKFLELRQPMHLRRKLHRFLSWKRPLPLLFVAMSLVLLVRGLVIPPFFTDALSYRIPRILNWIAEGRWYWIDAQDARLNVRGVVSEWLTLPLLLTWKWDQLVFLPNWISLLFFPHLIFQVWRDWGVSSRATWLWMWLLPAGFCYSLQACNAGNDILGTFFGLASFALLRKREAVSPADMLCSILAIALATGVKLTLGPLIIPWLILACARWKWFARWPWLTLGGSVWAVPLSFIPNVATNLYYVGSASGLSLEPDVLRPVPFLDRVIGNIFLLTKDNLASPLNGLHALRAFILRTQPEPMIQHRFEPDSGYLHSYFSVENEGIGIILVLAGALMLVAAKRRLGRLPLYRSAAYHSGTVLLHASMWEMVFYFVWINTSSQGARLISGYYPYLLASLFVGIEWPSTNRRRLAAWTAGLGVTATILSAIFLTDYPVFVVWKSYNEHMKFVKVQEEKLLELVPSSEKNIGMMRYWFEMENWAWEPYGRRRVYQLPNDVSPSEISRLNIHYIIITELFLQKQGETIEEWTAVHHATVEGETLRRLDEGNAWGCYFVKLNDAGAAVASPQPPPAKPTPPS